MNQLKLGAILSYITILVANLVGLILTPFIIKNIGDAEYGLYTLIGSFIAYLGVLDFGMNNAVIRYVAKYKINNDKDSEENFLAISLIVYITISVIVAVVGSIIYVNLGYFFDNSLTAIEMEKAKIMLLILIANLVFSLPGGIFIAICSGREKFVFAKSIVLIKYIFRSILVVIALLKGGDSISIVVVDTIANLLMIIASGYYVFFILKVRFKLYEFDLTLLKNIFEYSFWIFISAIAFNFYWSSGQFIVGIKENTEAVAVFGIGILLGGYYGAFSSAINSMLVPRAMQNIKKGSESKELTALVVRYGRLNLLVLLLIITGFYIFGKTFVLLWVGDSYIDSVKITLTIMLAMTPVLVQGFANSILEAKRKNKLKAILNLITTSIGVLLGWYSYDLYGMYGIAVSLAASMFLNAIVMMFYYRYVFNFNIIKFISSTYLKPLVTLLPLVGIIKYFSLKYLTVDWMSLALWVILYIMTYAIINYFFIFNKSEKLLFKGKLS